MRSICFFSSYYTGDRMPDYVKFYLEELIRHFTETVCITNEKTISDKDIAFLKERSIQLMLVKNEGYDFGMWYKAFQKYNVNEYDRIGLVNDSCILFNKLDDFFSWVDNESADYCGFTENNMFSYHIQSYFLIINKKAIPLVKEYFDKNGIISDMKSVIMAYEIGLSNYLVKSGVKVKAFCKGSNNFEDPTWVQAKALIKHGYPLIKKRIIARNYGEARYTGIVAQGFDPYPSHYIRLIRNITGSKEIDKIFFDVLTKMSLAKEVKFHINCMVATIYGKIRKFKRKAKQGTK